MSGTKVTTDPESKNRIKEAPGFVAADSLAAESGEFSEVSSVPGKSSTANTTDTSSAKKLEPAEHAEDRKDGSGTYPDSIGKAKTGGSYTAAGYAGGPSSNKHATSGQSGSNESSTSSGKDTGSSAGQPSGSSEHHVETAPGYAHAQRTLVDGKPKGSNLKEVDSFDGGQSSDVTEIVDTDSKDNPSRLAEQKFEAENARPGGSGAGSQGKVDSGTGLYDALKEE